MAATFGVDFLGRVRRKPLACPDCPILHLHGCYWCSMCARVGACLGVRRISPRAGCSDTPLARAIHRMGAVVVQLLSSPTSADSLPRQVPLEPTITSACESGTSYTARAHALGARNLLKPIATRLLEATGMRLPSAAPGATEAFTS